MYTTYIEDPEIERYEVLLSNKHKFKICTKIPKDLELTDENLKLINEDLNKVALCGLKNKCGRDTKVQIVSIKKI